MMARKNIFLITVLMIFLIQRHHVVNGKIYADKNISKMIADATIFCENKPKTDFCNPEYLKMMINSAALSQGKEPPIEDIDQLEWERKKVLEKIKLNKAKEELQKLERQRQRQLNAQKAKLKDLMKKLDTEKNTLGQILTSFDKHGQNFRY